MPGLFQTDTTQMNLLNVLFIGKNEIDKNYFCNLIFNENCDDIYLGE
jgi:hypothetical protein